MQSDQTQENYDVIVVGGGLAGVLSVIRMVRSNPNLKILLIEKNSVLGGRLRSTHQATGQWACGLRGISEDLYNFWNQIMKEDPDGDDLPEFGAKQQSRLGILQAGKLKEVPYDQAFTEVGAKAFAGPAAVRDWNTIEKLYDAEEKGLKTINQGFSQGYTGNKRSPAAPVIENLSLLWGIPDLWSTQTKSFLERSRFHKSAPYIGDWDQAIDALLGKLSGANLTTELDCRIVDSDYKDDVWTLSAEKGSFQGKRLVITVPPWEAQLFLPRRHWPKRLASLTSRTKPASLVVLSEFLENLEDVDLPDVMLIPAEGVQVTIDGHEICFRATLDFELTMQAPAVVKAVKRLRRARKKFLAAFPNLNSSGDYLALIPVGWATPLSPGDRRVADPISTKDLHQDHLLFCGDGYGSDINGDKNFLTSVLSTTDHISNQTKDT